MNRDFLVSGGVQGIGFQFCRKILTGGGRVFIADIDEENGKTSKAILSKEFGPKVEFGKLDVRDEDEWRTVWDAAEAFFGGQVQGFCNNAGIFHHTDWMKVKQINLDGMMFGSMLAYERMGIKRGGQGGVMVITGSINSFVGSSFDFVEESAYAVSKHGVLGFVRSLGIPKIDAIEKVRTVGICPWFVDTNLVRSNIGDPNVIQSRYKIRMLQPSEVGDAFERLVVEGRSGDMLVVMPGANFFWPDMNRKLLLYFVIATKIAKKVFGIPEGRIVTSSDFIKLGIMLVLFVFLLFHIFLGWIGL